MNVAVEPGGGVGVSVPGGGGTVGGGATVPVGSTSNVAVGVGWIVGVETVSKTIGAYALYGPIEGAVPVLGGATVGSSAAALLDGEAR